MPGIELGLDGLAAGWMAVLLDALIKGTAILARPSRLEGRLVAILDPRRSRRRLTFFSAVLAALLLAGLAIPLAMLQARDGREAKAEANAVAATQPEPNQISQTRWSWQQGDDSPKPAGSWEEAWKQARKYPTQEHPGRTAYLRAYQRVLDARPPREIEVQARMMMAAALRTGFEPSLDKEALPWCAETVLMFLDMPEHRDVMVARNYLAELLRMHYGQKHAALTKALFQSVLDVLEDDIVFDNESDQQHNLAQIAVAKAGKWVGPGAPPVVLATPVQAKIDADYRQRLLAERKQRIASLRQGAAWHLEGMAQSESSGRAWSKDDPFGDAPYQTALDQSLKLVAASLAREANAGAATQPGTQPAAERIAALIVGLGAERWQDRDEAQKALEAIGIPALRALEAAQRDRDPERAGRAEAAAEAVRRPWGLPVGGIRCGVRPAKAAFTPGEDIVLDVVYWNVSRRPITVCTYPDTDWKWIQYDLGGHRGGRVDSTARPLAESDFTTLQPGQFTSSRGRIRREWFGNEGLTPGAYATQVTLNQVNRMDKIIPGFEDFCRKHGLAPWIAQATSGRADVTIVPVPEILWGEPVGSLVCGLAKPQAAGPALTLEAFLKNVGKDKYFDGAVLELEVDGNAYVPHDWTAHNARQLYLPPGEIMGPYPVVLSDYVAEADRRRARQANRPLSALAPGKHRLRVTYMGMNGTPRVPGPEVVVKVPSPKPGTAQPATQPAVRPGSPPATQPAEVSSARIDALVVQLGSQEFEDRQKAHEALVRIGQPAAPALRKATRGRDPERSQKAQAVLADPAVEPA